MLLFYIVRNLFYTIGDLTYQSPFVFKITPTTLYVNIDRSVKANYFVYRYSGVLTHIHYVKLLWPDERESN